MTAKSYAALPSKHLITISVFVLSVPASYPIANSSMVVTLLGIATVSALLPTAYALMAETVLPSYSSGITMSLLSPPYFSSAKVPPSSSL